MPLDVGGDAFRLGRGRRSGVGIGLFNSGGVVVDGGCKDPSRAAPIVSRIPFPDEWRVVLVLDRKRTGVHGEEERSVFARLPPFAAADAAHICRLVLMQALPALVEADLTSFAAAIKECKPSSERILHGCKVASSPAARWPRPWKYSKVKAGWASVKAHGDLPLLPSHARAMKRGGSSTSRISPRCRAVDIHACKGINRGAE